MLDDAHDKMILDQYQVNKVTCWLEIYNVHNSWYGTLNNLFLFSIKQPRPIQYGSIYRFNKVNRADTHKIGPWVSGRKASCLLRVWKPIKDKD